MTSSLSLQAIFMPNALTPSFQNTLVAFPIDVTRLQLRKSVHLFSGSGKVLASIFSYGCIMSKVQKQYLKFIKSWALMV